MKAILAIFRLSQFTLYGKVTLAMKITLRFYKLYLQLKFNKMSDIQKIKEILKPSIKLTVELIEDIKDDKKLQTGELIGIIPEVLGFIKVIPNFKEALAELKDFDIEDAKELIVFVQGIKDLDETKAKVIIVNVIEIYEKLTDVYEDNVKNIIALF